MRPIDADALEEKKFPVHGITVQNIDTYNAYQLGWNDAIGAIMINEPTVEAIPIEWIKQYGKENCFDFGTQFNAITCMLKAWEERKG